MKNTLFLSAKTIAISKRTMVMLFCCGVLGVTLSTSSCKSYKVDKEFSEGIIEYTIIYDEGQPFKHDPKLRPDKMVVKFKDNNTINKIEGLSGGFMFSMVQNYKENQVYTLIKILGKKIFLSESINDGRYPYAYTEMPSISIQKTDEKIVFMGLNCAKAIATFNDSLGHSFEILYTNELAINNPNKNTPFEEIEGIMLKFSAVLMKQNMQIVARSIKSRNIPDDEFILPKGYEQIDEDTLEDIFELMQ
ncbi:MAG: hypothetical protein PHE03_00450 [Bacteroidales bacterium]|nr:hypothetical protein [Bacteroidales bacterium]MDD3890758.1 hypothetical protein [Bacteroidales bacterium]